MSIEEKKKPLEFTYIPDGVERDVELVNINVAYNPDNVVGRGLFPVIIRGPSGQEISCPVEFFQEVVDFLVSKGVIKSEVLSRTVRSSFAQSPDFALPGSSIPLPKIEKKEQENTSVKVADPLASFDITSEESEVKKKEGRGPVVTAEQSVPPDINRSVIRSRVKGDDPLSAEKEAAELRKAIKKGTKKTIKRKS